MNATVSKAARYFKMAADQGDADAQWMDAQSIHPKMAGKKARRNVIIREISERHCFNFGRLGATAHCSSAM